MLNYINTNTDIILGTYCEVDPDGNEKVIDKPEIIVQEDMLPYEYFMKLGNVSYAAVRFIVKRNVLLKNNLMFTSGIYHEDEDWTPRVLCNCKKISVIDEVIYKYRVGNTSSIMGMLNPKKVKDKIAISERIYDYSKKVNESQKEFLNTRVEHMYIAALNEYCLYNNNVRKELIKYFKEKKFLLKINKSKKSKFVLCAINLVGFLNTSKLLRFRNNIR